jgi:hypothetical protein
MQYIIDFSKFVQQLSEVQGAFSVLKDFEKVLSELNIYVFKNWKKGELIKGPVINRYTVKCTFMWDYHTPPDPKVKELLEEYDCKVTFDKDLILVPRKIKDPEDYRPGTKKGKIDAHKIWTATIEMPKKLIQDVSIGKENQENNLMAELMRYNKNDISLDTAAQESPQQNETQPQQTA